MPTSARKTAGASPRPTRPCGNAVGDDLCVVLPFALSVTLRVPPLPKGEATPYPTLRCRRRGGCPHPPEKRREQAPALQGASTLGGELGSLSEGAVRAYARTEGVLHAEGRCKENSLRPRRLLYKCGNMASAIFERRQRDCDLQLLKAASAISLTEGGFALSNLAVSP